MQARVNPRCRSRTRDDAVILHIKHVGVDVDLRVHVSKGLRVHPMRCCTTAIEQSGCRQGERTATDGEHPGSARDRPFERCGDSRIHRAPRSTRNGSEHDHVGVISEGEVVFDVHRVADAAADSTGLGSQHSKVERLDAVVGAIETEGFAG